MCFSEAPLEQCPSCKRWALQGRASEILQIGKEEMRLLFLPLNKKKKTNSCRRGTSRKKLRRMKKETRNPGRWGGWNRVAPAWNKLDGASFQVSASALSPHCYMGAEHTILLFYFSSYDPVWWVGSEDWEWKVAGRKKDFKNDPERDERVLSWAAFIWGVGSHHCGC